MNRVEVTDFSCPNCGSDVELQPSGVVCGQCKHTFPVNDDIVDFRLGRKDYYFNPIPREEMRKLNSGYSPDRWNETVRQFLSFAPSKGGWIDNLVVDGRYAWKVFLDLAPGLKMLDLGCGLGNLSKNLAPHVGKLYAMDLTYERLGFAKNRFATFNRDDDIALLAAGDSARLPFRDSSMDIVVLSGVLEWVGQGDMSEYDEGSKLGRLWRGLLSPIGRRSPRRLQLDFLKEIRRILKESGQLFVGIENRLNHEYFAGRPDHHSSLPYGALLPRMLANLYSLYRNRQPYRTYTYSLGGYRQLMKDAGFNESEFVSLHQGYSFVEEMIPASGDFGFWEPEKEDGLKLRLKRLPHFAPAFGIISGTRGRPRNRLLNEVLDHVAAGLAEPAGTIRVTKLEVSSKDKLIVHALRGDSPTFIKLPFSAEALQAEQNNHERLKWLREHRSALREYVPLALFHGETAHQNFFVETGVDGAALATKAREGNDVLDCIRVGLGFLERLNPVDELESKMLDAEVYEELITTRLTRLKEIIAPDQVTRLEDMFRRYLEDARFPHGLVHGDYSASNVLLSDGEVRGVLDWEESQSRGIPAIDAVCLLISGGRLRTPGPSFAERVFGIARREAEYGDLLGLIDEYYEKTGTDPARHAGIVFLYWLHAVCHRLRFGLVYDQDGIHKYIGSVVAQLEMDRE